MGDLVQFPTPNRNEEDRIGLLEQLEIYERRVEDIKRALGVLSLEGDQ